MSGLTVGEATVHYGATTALDNVSLRVDGEEIVALLGPSGCGKSTLLRLIAGLEPTAAGRVRWGDEQLDGLAPHRRRIGLMFQDHALFPHRNVAENIGFGLRMQGLSTQARRDRVAELLRLVRLDGFGDRAIRNLSGGEAQRVALARSLAPQPRLLMLDEPFASLDRNLRDQLVTDVGHLLRSEGLAAIHVTHDHEEAFAIADRLVVMRAGKIVASGAPAELWARPPTAWAAEFLGHRNLLPVSVDGAGTTTVLGPIPHSPLDGDAAPVVAIIRSDRVAVVAPSTEASIPATVVSSRFGGSTSSVVARLDDGTHLHLHSDSPCPPGDVIGLTMADDAAVVVPDDR